MKKILFLVLLFTQGVIAQKRNLTMAEAVNGLSTTLAVKNLPQLKWMGNKEFYSHVISNDTENVIIAYSPVTFEAEVVMSLEKMNQLLKKNGLKKLTKIPAINWLSNTAFYFQQDNKYVQINTLAKDSSATQILTSTPKEAENATLNANQTGIAYTYNNNLYVKVGNNEPLQITQDGSKDIEYGTAVHRNEFGINEGLFWSPLNDAIAFYRMDQSMVENYPVVNWAETPAIVNMVKYPFAGRTSHQVTLGVYNIKTASTLYLKTGDPKDQYLTSVTWSPDAKYLYVGLLNRDQNYLQLNQYDAVSGEKIKTLFEERNDKYVEPQHALYFVNNNPEQFIWWSQRDGYMHLYLYKKDGTLIRPLTQGPWLVNEILGVNKKNQELTITATKESPLQKTVYAVRRPKA